MSNRRLSQRERQEKSGYGSTKRRSRGWRGLFARPAATQTRKDRSLRGKQRRNARKAQQRSER